MSAALVQRISVPFEYPVAFTRDALDEHNATLVDLIAWREPTRRHRALFVVDDGVAAGWPELPAQIERYAARFADRLELSAPPMVVQGGEACKNDGGPTAAMQASLDRLGMDRQSFVVAIGGGALLDMAGYAAATAHRGVRMVRLPTTVLSQGDSGVGVKNGINAFGKKNFLGTFAPPFGVVLDGRFLETLSRRDMVAGMSEAVKVSLIRDREFFEWIEERVHELAQCAPAAVERLVRRSAELHLAHIAGGGDPFEMGSARPLDFGHWAAHKLESLTTHRLRHGEAVAVGMAIDTLYSVSVGLCAPALAERVLSVLRALGLPTWDDALSESVGGRRRVLDGLTEFREHLGGELTVTLLADVGRGVEVHEMQEPLVLAAIDRLREEAGR
jgi:3-dehydroquinate synthase